MAEDTAQEAASLKERVDSYKTAIVDGYNTVKTKHADNGFVTFFTKSIKVLDTIINTIDRVLKEKANFDAGKTYDTVKEKSKFGFSVVKNLAKIGTDALSESTLGKKVLDIKSKADEQLASDVQTSGAPPTSMFGKLKSGLQTGLGYVGAFSKEAIVQTTGALTGMGSDSEVTSLSRSQALSDISKLPVHEALLLPILEEIYNYSSNETYSNAVNILTKLEQLPTEVIKSQISVIKKYYSVPEATTLVKNKGLMEIAIKKHGKEDIPLKPDTRIEPTEQTEETDQSEQSEQPEQSKESGKPSLKDKVKAKAKGAFSAVKSKIGSFFVADDIARTDVAMDKAKERTDKRAEEVKAEKEAAKKAIDDKKKAKSKGWLGKIFTAIKFLTEKIASGIGWLGPFLIKGMFKPIGWLAGFLGKSTWSMLTKLMPGLTTRLATMFSGGVGTVLRTVLTTVLSKIPFLGAAASAVGSGLAWAGTGMASIAGKVGLAKASVVMAANPVGAAVLGIAAVGVGAYYGYKYLTRNRIPSGPAGDLTRYRLMLYGVDITKESFYHKFFKLEGFLKKKIKYANNRTDLIKMTPEDKEEVLDIFDINKKDEKYKEKLEILNNWFGNRFIPVFLNAVTELKNINSELYLDEYDKLRPAEMQTMLSRISVHPNIYNITTLPLFESEDTSKINVTQDTINTFKLKLLDTLPKPDKTDPILNRPTPKPPIIKQPEIPVPPADSKTAPAPKIDMPATGSSANSPMFDTKKPEPGEKDAKESPISDLKDRANQKLATAGGPLVEGTTDATGINLKKVGMAGLVNMHPDVVKLFSGMAKEYNTLTGKSIMINSGFRSAAEQARMRGTNKPSPLGKSLHEAGAAIDIPSVTANELEKMGLLRKYGFTRPVGAELWHLEPAGVATDPHVIKNDPALISKYTLASPGAGGGGYAMEKGSIMNKRNVGLQKRLFSTKDSVVIDPKTNLDPATKAPGSVTDTPIGKTVQDQSATPKPTPGVSTDANTATPAAGSASSPVAQTSSATPVASPSSPTPPIVDVSKVSDPTEKDAKPNTDLGRYAEMDPKQAIAAAAKLTGVNESLLRGFVQLESGFRPAVKAKTSNATGLMQFVPRTWESMVKTHGPKYNIPPDAQPTNPYYSAILGAEYIKLNMNQINSKVNWQKTGLDESTVAYLGHHFGAGGASSILRALISNPNTPMQQVVSENAYNANRSSIGNKTVREFTEYLRARLSGAMAANPTSSTGKPLVTTPSTSTPPPTSVTPEPSNMTPAGTDTSPRPSTGALGGDKSAIVKPTDFLASSKDKAIPVGAASSTSAAISATPTSKPSDALFKEPVKAPMYQQAPTPVPETATAAKAPQFSTAGVESILNNQLKVLTGIAEVLGTINGKIDFDKLKGILGTSSSTPTRPTHKVSNSGVSLDREPGQQYMY